MSNVYLKSIENRSSTPQTKPIPGKPMVKNSAGGYSFTPDDMSLLRRFLILGTEGGSFYASESKLTEQNAKRIVKLITSNGVAVVKEIVEISESGRAPKNDPALFALALVLTHGDVEARKAAENAIPQVARIGTHILHLAAYVDAMRSWGRGIRRGFSKWYNEKSPLQLAQQITKYANRDGWTHLDVLRLAHPTPATPTHEALFAFLADKVKEDTFLDIDVDVAQYMAAIEEVKRTTDVKQIVKLIEAHRLPREVLPTESLNDKRVWEALVPHMGYTALVRNLAKMTSVGYIAPLSNGTKAIIDKLSNVEDLRKSKIHPIQILSALLTYQRGHGVRGSLNWLPNHSIIGALDTSFYAAFKNVVPTNKKNVLALDVSGSMSWSELAGVPGLTPRIGAAVMAMVTYRVEKECEVLAFSDKLVSAKLTPNMTLAEVHAAIDRIPMGGTDCSLPMLWAKQNKVDVDAFAVYTDSETWAGRVAHPSQALSQYRKAMDKPDAKMIVVGMVSNGFTIADPADRNQLDVVGFDTATPSIIADFVRGDI